MSDGDRFWISTNRGNTWTEVNKQEWVRWEQDCGFYDQWGRDIPSTEGFEAGQVWGIRNVEGPR